MFLLVKRGPISIYKPSIQVWDSHGRKTILSLTYGNPYAGKTVSLDWQDKQTVVRQVFECNLKHIGPWCWGFISKCVTFQMQCSDY